MHASPPRPDQPRFRKPWALIASVFVILVAVVCLLWLGGWASPDLGPNLAGFVSSTLPAISIAGYFLLVGAASLAAVPGYRWGRASLAIGVAVGIGVSGLIVALSYFVLGSATAVILPLGIVAVGVLVLKVVLGLRRDGLADSLSTHRLLVRMRSNPDLGTPLVAAVVAVAALAPVARYGLTSWTTGTHDFPAYVARAQTWITASTHATPFLVTHPDTFGLHYSSGASWEKPTSTAVTVIAAQVSGLRPDQLLLPLMLIMLASLISTSAYIARRVFGLRAPLSWIAAVLPALSIVPFSRIIDAQVGQPIMVTLFAGFLALWASLPRSRRSWALVWPIILTGVVATAALGADFTLAAGIVPPVAAAMVWLSIRRGVPVRATLARGALVAVVIALGSAPFVHKYLQSLMHQTDGLTGFNVPLATPLALIGLQTVLFHTVPLGIVLAAWAVLCVLVVLAVLLRLRRSLAARYLLGFIGVVLLTAVGLAVRYGPNNYVLHKWSAVVIAILTPLLLAQVLVSHRRLRGRIGLTIATVIATGSLGIAIAAATAVPSVIPAQLEALASNVRLAAVPALNVDLSDFQQEAMAPFMVSSRRVIAVATTSVPASPPVGNQFLIAASSAPRNWTRVVPLNDLYSLATVNLTMGAGTTRFTAANPSSSGYLFGDWSIQEASGTWSDSGADYVVFDPASDLTGDGVEITIAGVHYAAPHHPRTLSILANGQVIDTVTSTSANLVSIHFRLSKARLASLDGRVAIEFSEDSPLSPASVGQGDPRKLVFQLTSVTLGR